MTLFIPCNKPCLNYNFVPATSSRVPATYATNGVQFFLQSARVLFLSTVCLSVCLSGDTCSTGQDNQVRGKGCG